MSAVLDTPTLRQRTGLRAYNAAHAQAILTSERQALRTAEAQWRAQPRPLPVHRTQGRPTQAQRLRAALASEYGRRWPLALLAAALYFGGGALGTLALVALVTGVWQP